MPAPTLPEAVKAMRSYQAVSRATPTSPNALSGWIEKQTDAGSASSFSHLATQALLHYYNHPLYSVSLSTDAQAWVSFMSSAESILADEETWIDAQLTLANGTMVARLFNSDNDWLRTWGNNNSIDQDTPIAYVVNALIAQLQICEGSNGATGASSIPHTTQTPPNAPSPSVP